MSLQLIQEYHHKVQEILRYGGSRNETTTNAWRFYDNSRPEGPLLIASGRLNAKDMIVDGKLWKMIQEDFSERS